MPPLVPNLYLVAVWVGFDILTNYALNPYGCHQLLWAMLCIALGMAITTSLFALGAIGFRNTFLALAHDRDTISAGIHGVLSIGGALCIAVMGVVLLLGSF